MSKPVFTITVEYTGFKEFVIEADRLKGYDFADLFDNPQGFEQITNPHVTATDLRVIEWRLSRPD